MSYKSWFTKHYLVHIMRFENKLNIKRIIVSQPSLHIFRLQFGKPFSWLLQSAQR